MALADIAPLRRAASFPPRNKIIVGMRRARANETRPQRLFVVRRFRRLGALRSRRVLGDQRPAPFASAFSLRNRFCSSAVKIGDDDMTCASFRECLGHCASDAAYA